MSFTPAHIITSSQNDIHQSLEKVVLKHSQTVFQKPIVEHNQLAFDHAYRLWVEKNRPRVFLDSACGTGESTRFLAAQYPNVLVIGLDQSQKRLNHNDNQHLPDNCLLLRCDCTDFWRLAANKEWRFEKHFLLYPNPYPKPDDLKKRWHGHPAFVALLNISQCIELRTNWELYAKEFAFAVSVLKNKTLAARTYNAEIPITAFERKYKKSAHTLWRFIKE